MMQKKVDTLIIGAGLIGSSVAMHLAQQGQSDVLVVDFDLEGSFSSSELNAGGVRATWNQPINILSSKLTIDYFAKNAKDVGYHDCGYLWLLNKEKSSSAHKSKEVQEQLGWPVESWTVDELRKKVPFIDKTEDIESAIFAPKDGLVNPNLVKNHFRSKAQELGVEFLDRIYVYGLDYQKEANFSLKVLAKKYPKQFQLEQKREFLLGKLSSIGSEKVTIEANKVVNCAGPWASQLAKILGYNCPSYPLRRQICIFDCRDVDLTSYGMIVDTSGVYFHPEATNGLAGYSGAGELKGFNFNYDGEEYFMEHIWPALYERSSSFERLKHLTGWSGLYEMSPDHSAIIGLVESGTPSEKKYLGSVYEAHSFSGHGAMHSYAAGLGLAEKMLKGKYETIDFNQLSSVRFNNNQLVSEGLTI